jgi:hypothetical protein
VGSSSVTSLTLTAVPEPSTAALVVVGFALLRGFGRSRGRRGAQITPAL